MDDRYFWTLPIEVRWRDTDGLGHVNNAVYLTYFEAVRVQYGLHLLDGQGLRDIPFILGETTVRYIKPVFFGDAIVAATRVERIGGKSFTLSYELRRGAEIVTTGTSVLVWYDYAAERTMPVPAVFRERVIALQGPLPEAGG